MDREGDIFPIDKELNLCGVPSKDISDKSLESLESVEKGHYLLIYIDNYSYVAEIARAVVTKKAAVESVLKKDKNRWTIMVKNDVPVAQIG